MVEMKAEASGLGISDGRLPRHITAFPRPAARELLPPQRWTQLIVIFRRGQQRHDGRQRKGILSALRRRFLQADNFIRASGGLH